MNTKQSPAEHPRPWLANYPNDLSPEIEPFDYESVPDFVRATVGRHGTRPAFTNMGTSLTFAEVDKLSDDLATYFQNNLKLVKGDRIILQMPNLLQYPVAIFAALKAGLVVVNANPLYTAPEMLEIFQDSGAVAILLLENFAHKLETILPKTEIRHVIVTEVGDLTPPLKRVATNFVVKNVKKLVPPYSLGGVIRLRDALAIGARGTFTAPKLTHDDVALLQYTGGTTGKAKGAMITHYNLLANQFQMMGPMRRTLREGHEIILAALPMYHIFCLTVNCLGFFQFGANNVLITDPRDRDALVKDIKRTKPTIFILVGTLAASLLDDPNFLHTNLSFLKLTVCGGMAVRQSVAERWKAVTGTELIEGYGLTEASPVVSVGPIDGGAKIGTIGWPLPSTDVEIRDEQGHWLPIGQVGEITVHGPQVMSGYWHQPDETKLAIDADGWLRTGDIGFLDDDGFITIVDRKKDIVVVSGFNVFPSEVEGVLLQDDRIAEVGVVGIPDEHSGERVEAYIVKRDPTLTEDDVRAFAKERLAAYKRPKVIEFRTELPKTNVGKVLRRELRDT